MKPFLQIAELTTGQADRFAVVSIDPTCRDGDGCKGVIVSLHSTREEARAAICLESLK